MLNDVKHVRVMNVSRKRYPFVGFRPTEQIEQRLNKLAKASGKSKSELLLDCITRHLPSLEQKIFTAK